MNFQRLVPILALLLWTAAAPAQPPAPSSDPALIELVRESVSGIFDLTSDAHRFTFFEQAHTQNRDHNGKLYYDRTTLSETTYINDLPYSRLLEVDGKPLAGKSLAEEQARYDQAVRARTALDAAARAHIGSQIERSAFINAALPYSQLTTRFRLTDLHQEPIDTPAGTLQAHVIDAVPLPSTNPLLPTETRHLKLWIAPTGPGTKPYLLRADFDYIAPARTSEGAILPPSHGRITYTLMDGITVPDRKEMHTFLVPGKDPKPKTSDPMQIDVARTYTRYRQFSATIQVLPPGSGNPLPQQ